MNKLITSFGLAVVLLASSTTGFAQKTVLSEAQKASIQSELFPAVFEQVKEQTGLDILGLADPQSMAESFATSPYFKMATSLRASKTPVDVLPDSVILNTSALSSNAIMSSMLGSFIKITFSGFAKEATTLPVAISGYSLNMNLPTKILISSSKLSGLAEIDINSQMDGLIGTISITASSTPFNWSNLSIITIKTLYNETTSTTDAQLTIGDGLKSILKTLPDYNYLAKVNLISLMTTGAIGVNVYAVASADTNFAQPVPMYETAIGMDMQTLTPKYLDLTEYTNATASKFLKMWFSKTQATPQDLVLKADVYAYKSSAKTDSVYTGSDIATMTDYTAASTTKTAALRSFMGQILEDLATGTSMAPYKLTIQKATAAKDTATVLVATATPSMTATGASALINIISYDSANVVSKNYDVLAVADTLGLVKVTATPNGATDALVTGYFRSNALSVITANETIAAGNVKIVNGADGFYVSNASRGSYQIVDMKGSIVANGMITSDYKYIPTSAFVHGIYVIVVRSASGNATLKFAK